MRKYLILFMFWGVFSNAQYNLFARQNFASINSDNPDIISYWQMENNVDDSVGTNNGVATGITYGSGLVGQNAIYDGTDYISISDSDNLSFTNGINDLPFSISLIANFSSTGDRWLVNKRGGTSGTDEYQFIYYLGKLSLWCFNYNNNAGYIVKEYSFTPTLGQNYMLTATYNGNGLHTGLSIYVDGVSVGTSSLTGTYTRMNNGTGSVVFGRFAWAGGGYFIGKLDEIVIWNTELNSAQVGAINTTLLSGNHLN